MNRSNARLVTGLTLSALCFLGAAAQAATFEADPAHSAITFSIKHMTISTVNGSFADFNGTVENPNDKDWSKAKVQFTVKTASINTAQSKRDEHLKSGDFFDVEKFPEATFVSDKIVAHGKSHYKMMGKLTIHGVTKDTTFDVTANGAVDDPYGNHKVGFEATTEINRKDFGLSWNKTLDKGGLMLGEKVKMNIQLELAEKKADKKSS